MAFTSGAPGPRGDIWALRTLRHHSLMLPITPGHHAAALRLCRSVNLVVVGRVGGGAKVDRVKSSEQRRRGKVGREATAAHQELAAHWCWSGYMGLP